jgi:hypothetical protein
MARETSIGKTLTQSAKKIIFKKRRLHDMNIRHCYSFVARIGEILMDKSLSDSEKTLLIKTWYEIVNQREQSENS